MAVSWLRRLASSAPVPVFVAVGVRGEEALSYLALAPGIELVASPRHASVLLVAGGIAPDLFEPLRRVHDQLPRPFVTLWFRSTPLPECQHDPRIDELGLLADTLAQVHRELMAGHRESSASLLPDVPPNLWEGVGPFGQGGEGMMGGVPYGRPMAMNMQADIRDGLTLDSLTFRLGPFFSGLPPGMKAQLTLQGDLIQRWNTLLAPYPQSLDAVFFDALEGPAPIAALEIARARHHLCRLSFGLRLAGLERLGLEALRLMTDLSSRSSVAGLRRHLVRSGFFHATARNGRLLDDDQARWLGGPAARASGIQEDLRSADPHYCQLGFAPVIHRDGDNRTRWQQLLAEIDQSLHLAREAETVDMHTAAGGCVETPRGPWREQRPEDASRLLDDLMPGLEWGEALATIASLDLAAVSPWRPEAPRAPGQAGSDREARR